MADICPHTLPRTALDDSFDLLSPIANTQQEQRGPASSSRIHHLPLEILWQTFDIAERTALQNEERSLPTLSWVCRYWRAACDLPTLWRRILITSTRNFRSSLIEMYLSRSKDEEIELDIRLGSPESRASLVIALAALLDKIVVERRCRSFELSIMDMRRVLPVAIAFHMLPRWEGRLVHLTLALDDASPRHQSPSSFLRECTSIRSLVLISRYFEADGQDIKVGPINLPHLTSLEARLQGNRLRNPLIQLLNLLNVPNLTSLIIDWDSRCISETFDALISLPIATNLTSLILSDGRWLTEEMFLRLAPKLPALVEFRAVHQLQPRWLDPWSRVERALVEDGELCPRLRLLDYGSKAGPWRINREEMRECLQRKAVEM